MKVVESLCSLYYCRFIIRVVRFSRYSKGYQKQMASPVVLISDQPVSALETDLNEALSSIESFVDYFVGSGPMNQRGQMATKALVIGQGLIRKYKGFECSALSS